MSKKIGLLLLLILFQISLLGMGHASAATIHTMPLTIKPVIPANQIGHIISFFNLKVQAGQKQHLKLKLSNNTDHNLMIHIEPASAYTSANGGIAYLTQQKQGIIKKTYRLADNIDVQNNILLTPHQSKVIPFTVTVPSVQGTVLGGLVIHTNPPNKQQNQKNKGIQINSQIDYAVAVKLNLSRSGHPGGKLSFSDSAYQKTPSADQVEFGIQNGLSKIVDVGKVFFHIKGKQSLQGHFTVGKMAPKTEIQYPIALKHALPDGTYELDLKTTFQGKTITSQRTLTVGSISNKPKKNDLATVIQPSDKFQGGFLMNAWTNLVTNHFWVILCVGIVLLGISIFSVVKMKEKRYKRLNLFYTVVLTVVVGFLVFVKMG